MCENYITLTVTDYYCSAVYLLNKEEWLWLFVYERTQSYMHSLTERAEKHCRVAYMRGKKHNNLSDLE